LESSLQFKSYLIQFKDKDQTEQVSEWLSSYISEGAGYRVNWFSKFVEIRVPETFLHAQAGVALAQCLISQVTRQLFIAGTEPTDIGLISAGSPSIVPATGQLIVDQGPGGFGKQPDMSVGFCDLEDSPFVIAETGFSDAGTFTAKRVQNWLTDGRGHVRLSTFL
jgi:hypothetical protein